ncbi:MAG: ribose 5-phosphate isomerase B [Rhodospirillaceae bacterium]|nr:ribose 5-phosphate isomerase B [Rhodospirillaceae bacterium]
MSDLRIAQPGDVIAIASDHAGVEMKETLKAELSNLGFKPLDLGTNSLDSVDYPDYGHALAKAILDKKATAGVAVCGSGIGISIAANRHAGIRAALAHDENTAKLSREHNNANILALGARIVSPETAKAMLKTFFATEFAGGRHAGRIAKLDQ